MWLPGRYRSKAVLGLQLSGGKKARFVAVREEKKGSTVIRFAASGR